MVNNCSAYTTAVHVGLDKNRLEYPADANLIPALLRAFAEHVEGPCTVENATDVSLLIAPSDMMFWFTDPAHAESFKINVNFYLRPSVTTALTFW